MKHLKNNLWLAAILSIGSLQAQTFNSSASTSFTVWTVKGNVQYMREGSSVEKNVTPGMSLNDDATIVLSDKSAIQMVQNDNLVSITEKGKYHLSNDVKNHTAKQSAATAGFFNLLNASTKYHGSNAKAIDGGSGYGDGSKTKANDTGGGYGDGSKTKTDDTGAGYGDGSKTKADDTGAGYGDGSKTKADDTGGGYGDGSKTKTDDTGAGYGDGSKTKTDDTGGGYGDGSKTKTDDTGAGFGSKKEMKAKKKAALSPLKKDGLFKKSKKQQKILIQAATLENAGLNIEAKKCYKKALDKNPSDPVANQMYAAFLNRKH